MSDSDRRKSKYNNSYVKALEDQVQRLEAIVERTKAMYPEVFGQITNSMETETASTEHKPEPSDSSRTSYDESPLIVEESARGYLGVYGQSSVFVPRQEGLSDSTANPKVFEEYHDEATLKYISAFFRWHYPDYSIYLYREAFLTDFFRSQDDVKMSLEYCSEALIYAICSVGCRLCDNGHNPTEQSKFYYEKAKDLIFSNLGKSSHYDITTIQALLCLALDDLGRGDNFPAWILSGLAFRIGQHMGFDLDPARWRSSKSGNLLTDYDAKVRSRIYWGSFVADRVISLVLGRSSFLRYTESTIPDSSDLPLLIGIDEFQYIDPSSNDLQVFKVSGPLNKLISLHTMVDEYKQQIFGQKKEERKLSWTDRFKILAKFNIAIMKWKHNLGGDLSWTRLQLKMDGSNPNKMSLRYQYYLIILCFNVPFLSNLNHHNLKSELVGSQALCVEVLDDLYRSILCFRETHGLDKSSLMIVYLAIMATTALSKLPSKLFKTRTHKHQVHFHLDVLKQCSSVWGLAKRYCDSLQPVKQSVEGNLPTSTEESRFSELPKYFVDEEAFTLDTLLTSVSPSEVFETLPSYFDFMSPEETII
ncbi:hypothetical protein KL936_004548 [Ogataea polymorpha]|nr:hypothetical protein KL936_004548 [Ogataea polymorpha]